MKSLQEFTSLHKSDLVSILKNEDLQMNELEILGTAQNSTIPENQSVESIIFPSKLAVKQELPARIIELFSTIINEEHTAMISSQMNFDK
ncbi:hypothetical protein Glove_410g25 [Diversispora epigaea]|uniref:Uncharacterized protein n=1 Tax=Diversispora epigaea TaxID=1348612 RepID=A0A397GZN2_9GLOM|nr:hypothetical protein Glove_410g25 [Diversispora epigaea]